MKHIPIIGLDFIDSEGIRSTTCQLIEPGTGHASATARFKDGRLVGHRATYEADMGRFLADCTRLLRDSIPATSAPPSTTPSTCACDSR